MRLSAVLPKLIGVQLLVLHSAFFIPHSAFGQGALTPPGAPAPLFKTLDQVEPRTPISSLPITLSNSGSYYLTSNLTGVAGTNGITITADDVTLDLSGFALVGVVGSTNGILASGNRTNLLIRNGSIRNWGFHGLDSLFTRGGRFEDLRISSNGDDGMRVENGGVVTGCNFVSNHVSGLRAFNSVVKDCAAHRNGFDGITASASVIGGCFADFNAGSGISADDTLVIGCAAVGNLGGGISAGSHSAVRDCSVRQNTGGGIKLFSQATVANCMVSDHFATNGISAINPSIFDGSAILNNTCEGNDKGIVLGSNASGIRVEGNTIGVRIDIASGSFGLLVQGATNLIIRNSAHGYPTNYSIVSGNVVGPTNTAATILTNNNPNANFSF
jgi:parallel beta-helix repeat protein